MKPFILIIALVLGGCTKYRTGYEHKEGHIYRIDSTIIAEFGDTTANVYVSHAEHCNCKKEQP